jgi:Haem-dependent oxidative N-demethylase, alpha subunit-like
MPLVDLFPPEPYRFRLALQRDGGADFFRPRAGSGALLAERAAWLARDRETYAGLLPEGVAMLAELAELAADWAGRPVPADLARLGEALEPDLLLLSPDDGGRFRLRGGVLCFPTGWALREKLGQPLEAIHGVVPGLNAALGAPIHQFLSRLRPGPAWLRSNWGLAASDELNLHPGRALPPLAPPVTLERAWLRVERQALLVLPRTHGVLFGIRIERHRLDRVRADPAAAAGLRRALETMPGALAGYKRLAGVRRDLIALLA